jgi:hypothetical protein
MGWTVRDFYADQSPIGKAKAYALPVLICFHALDPHVTPNVTLYGFDQLIVLNAAERRRFRLYLEAEATIGICEPSQHVFTRRRRLSIRHCHEVGDPRDESIFESSGAGLRISASDKKRGADAQMKNDRG